LPQQLSVSKCELPEQEKLIGEIRKLMLEKLSIRVESAETDLLVTNTFDSMALVNLILHLEKHFGVDLPLGTLGIDPFRSVASIAELVARRKCERLP
jgi:acyl carrier protein